MGRRKYKMDERARGSDVRCRAAEPDGHDSVACSTALHSWASASAGECRVSEPGIRWDAWLRRWSSRQLCWARTHWVGSRSRLISWCRARPERGAFACLAERACDALLLY